MDVTIEEQRAFVKIMTLRHKKPSEIHQELVEACGEAAMALRTVQKWVKRVEDGESSTQDAARSGRPSTSNEEEHLEQLRALMETDRRWTCDELAEQMPQVSRTSIYRLLTDVLGMRKVAARWVPHNLSEEQKAERVTISRRLLQRQQRDSNFLDRIVAIDETWIRSYEPELKRQSAEWRHPDSPRPKKFRQKPSSMKLMMIAAYDSTGVILSHFVPQGQTVNAAYYSNYLRVHLRAALRRKRPNLMNPLILHDNASPHRARETLHTLEQLKWETIPHPPYSPDLSPPDFDLFGKLKEPLRGKRYESLDDLKKAAGQVLKSLNQNNSLDGLQRLPERWHRVLQNQGDYIEGH